MTTTRKISIELPADLYDALGTAAEERMVGRTLLITHLLRDGLERLVPVDELVRRRSDLDRQIAAEADR